MPTEISGSTGVNKIQDNTIVNADINSSAAIAGSKISGGVGKVLQVVSMNHNSETGTSSTSFIDNGLTLSITPSATSSKIYISVNQNSCRAVTNTVLAQMQLVRGSTVISLFEKECYFGTVDDIKAYGTNYLDSPSTTSAVTYKVQVKKVSGSGSFYFNSGGSNSTITLMEIAG